MNFSVFTGFTSRTALSVLGVAAAVMAGSYAVQLTASAQQAEPEKKDGKVVFNHVLDNQPIEFKFKPDQEITEAVSTFHETAVNPYKGQAEAIVAGKKIFGRLCVACHLKDGSGRIGPNLVDEKYNYERVKTDQGKFEIIYAGGAGAMQAFGRRITQDDILHVMAYLDELKATSTDKAKSGG